MKSRAVNRVLHLVGFLALMTFGPRPAHATHEPIAIDGNLADLIAAISRNPGASRGGFAVPDPLGDIFTAKCPPFTNGYDIENFYIFVDFKNPDGSVTTNPILYAGWDAFGVIGDVDGNGDPTTFNPTGPHGGCALSDQANIGAFESYRIFLNFCGTFSQIVIKDIDGNGTPDVQRDGVTIPGATVAFSGSGLELRVPNLATLYPDADLCNIQFIMTANAEQDGLGEDFNDTAIALDVPPSISIAKTPPTQSACPDRLVNWTITVTNDGLCDLATVTVRDTLDPGLTFVMSTPTRASGNDSISVFTFANVLAGETRTISLQARTAPTCTGTRRNRVAVIGVHPPPAGCTGTATEARAAAVVTVLCGAPPCLITTPAGGAPPAKVIAGNRVDLCAPAGFTYLWTRPSGATATTQCIVIASATAADSGTYRLRVTDTATCITECTFLLDVNPVGTIECRITGPDSLCVDEPLTLCGPREPAGVDFTYRWTLPDLRVIETPDSCLTVTSPPTGFYTLVVRNNATGATSDPCVHAFKVHKRPPCAISAPEVVEVGDAVQICGPFGNFGYLWTLPNGSLRTTRCVSIASVAFSDTGLYTLVVTDLATGCESVPCSYRLVLGDQPFECVITGAEKVTVGTRVEMCGPIGSFTYLWTRPNGSTSTDRCIVIPSAQTTDQGVYTLVLTNLSGDSETCEEKLLVNEAEECKNCPRTAKFWEEECAQLGGGKFSLGQLEAIAECVDATSSFFDFSGTPPTPPVGPLVPERATWRYHDLGANLGTAWKDPGYPDASWSTGPGVLGYGESYVNTTVSFGSNPDQKFVTTYFRTTFDVDDASSLIGLKLRVMYDDGLVVYLNGVEVARRSMPSGAPTYLTLAQDHEAQNTYESIDLDGSVGLVVDGTNVVAVEVHQTDRGSSDLVFDLELVGEIDHGLPAVRTEWRYHDLGLDLGTAWRDPAYPDGAWSSGPGVLGYGESYVETEVSFGSDSDEKFVTTYFRKSFDVTAASAIPALNLRLMYDDGVIVYLNGVEVARRRLTSGTVTYSTLASSHEADNQYETLNLSGFLNLLHDGTNVLAAEVHQSDRGSSDLVFDAGLEIPAGATAQAALVVEPTSLGLGSWTTPAPQGVSVALEHFCAILAEDPQTDRREAKRQFAALIANVCAGAHPPQSGDPVCLNPDTEVECKYFDASTIAELIVEVDARLATLESGPENSEEYQDLIECLTEINNGWSIDVSKECKEDDDDKKGCYTPVGLDVTVPLGPTAMVTFGQVTVEGTTFIVQATALGLPSGMHPVDGAAIDISSTATLGGYIKVGVRYDETRVHVPESDLHLLRFDAASSSWVEITTLRDAVNNHVEGMCDRLTTYVLVEPWSPLAADGPDRLRFGLQASSPNPTHGGTTLRYVLSRRGPAKLTVHDIQGRKVAMLASGTQEAGEYTVVWNGLGSDGRRLPSGIYGIRLEASEGLATTKLVIVN